jgi:hypothetical protein
MMDKIDDVPESRFKELEEIERENVKIVRHIINMSWKNHFKLEI